MTQALKKIAQAATNNDRKSFYILISMIVVAAFFYGYFVQQTILNVVAREKVLKEARVLNSAIGDLESSYMALKNNITLDFAYSKGFKDAETTEYISKRALGKLTNDTHIAF